MLQFLKIGSTVVLILVFPIILGVFIALISTYSETTHAGLPTKPTAPAIVATLDAAGAKEAADLLLKDLAAQKNSTQALAEVISKQLINENPTGPVLDEGLKKLRAPDVSEIINNYLKDGADNFNYQALKPEINDTDLSVIADRSPEALDAYLQKFLGILAQIYKNRAPQTEATSDPRGAAGELAGIYGDYMARLYGLAVPEPLAPAHKKQIASVAATKKIFEIMRDYDNDPLAAVLALNSLNVIQAENVDIYREMARVIAENKAGKL